jgi:hypothetical protein
MATPEFSAEQIIANLNTMGRPVTVLDEVLSILHENLPDVLDELGLPTMKGFDYAGVALDETLLPAILVSASVGTQEFGAGWADVTNVGVAVAYPPSLSRRDLQNSLDIATVVHAIMRMPTVVGARVATVGEVTTTLWSYLLPSPTSFSLIPPNWPLYAGWMANFVATQTPMNANLWPVE